MVVVVDDYIESGETLNFVKLVTALVDVTITRHKDTYFTTSLLSILREFAANIGNDGFVYVWVDFLCNKKNFSLAFHKRSFENN